MGRPSRQQMAERAAAQAMEASEAGRVLQAQRQPEPELEPKSEGERPPARNEPRRLAMEEIEKRDMQTKGITDESTPEPPAEKPQPAAEPASELETPAETPAEPDATPPATTEATPLETIRVKVDGEEFDAPKAEVEDYGGIKAFQIAKAAENRLKKANETVAKTQQTHAALVNWIQQQQQAQQPQLTPDQLIASKIDVIRYGTPEESAAALREVLEKSNPRIDQNALVQASTQIAVSKMQQSLAVEKFKEEFVDVVSNPLVLKLASTLENERIAEMQKAGHSPDWSSFYKQLGNEVRNVFGKPSQPAQTPTNGTPSQSEKEARKASIVTLPTASARAELPKESKPETRADTLNQMRQSRGIQTG